MKIKAGIIGGAGYTGGETLRLLLLHPNAEVVFVHSKSQAGKPVYSVHNDCLGVTLAEQSMVISRERRSRRARTRKVDRELSVETI